ncbi:MAG: MarR family transcriptional regulator [Treponema sp.]|nr:MarR family transcriptional regulator [Treponema sp.]
MNRTIKEEYIFGMVLLLANKLQIWGDNILEDITLKQWFLLMLISKMIVENPTIKEIAEFSGTSRQNTKKMLEQLAKKNYVKINKSKTDERALNIVLTKKTFSYFTENEKKAADNVNLLFNDITSDELNVTERTLEKLLKVFKIQPLELKKVN